MTQERWKRVNEIFHAALELSDDDREPYVRLAAEGDRGLEAEVRDLLVADLAAEGYFEAPVVAQAGAGDEGSKPPPLLPGKMLCGRFRIVRSVGEGGMGHVFEAYDTELAVTVALKVVHPEIAMQPGALARFQQEVRLARRITHPNVCRTFDIDRDAGVLDRATGKPRETVFLTMEFLEGETLAARLKRGGRMSLEEALALVLQVGSALGAAHALGIVHRDIKPANIVLAPGGAAGQRAVITDFGLARLDPVRGGSGGASLSHWTQVVGTLAYMAPEQMEGGPVSAATDLYALGLVLFEMVTGERAFPSESLLSGIWQRMSGATPSAADRVPGLPAEWEMAIQGCLRRRPEDRFQSAEDVVAVLRGDSPGVETSGRRAGQSARKARGGWLALGTAAALVLTVSLLAVGVRLYRSGRHSSADSRVAAGALVYLTQVTNETGEKRLDNLTELVREELEQSVHINLLDPVRADGYLEKMKQGASLSRGVASAGVDAAAGREVALRAGAARMILISLTGSGGDYQMRTVIEQPDISPRKARERWERSFAWHDAGPLHASQSLPPELLGAIRHGSEWIRANVGESANDIGRLDAPPEDVTTGDWQALMDFDQAERWLRTGRKDEAIALLQDAVRRDPGFARAYATLADNLVSVGRLSEGYQDYLKALNNDGGERLTRKERDYIKAAFATDTRDYGAAVEAFADSTAFYENDFYSWAYQAYPLNKLDRPRDALRVLERADRLSPDHGAAGEMAYAYLLLGDDAGARRAIEVARGAGHGEQATLLDGLATLCGGNAALATEHFVRLRTAEKQKFRILGRLGETRALAEQGRYAAAEASAASGTGEMAGLLGVEIEAVLWLDRAALDFDRMRGTEALREVEKALAESSAPDTILTASMVLGTAVPKLAGADRRVARTMLSRMQYALPREDLGVVFELARARVRGEALLADGDAAGALAAFRAADRLDAPLTPRDYLARGLLAVATHERNTQRKDALLREALAAYGRVALRPATVWIEAWSMPPGFVRDQMTAYLGVAGMLHQKDGEVARVAGSLATLRGSSTVIESDAARDAGEPINHHAAQT